MRNYSTRTTTSARSGTEGNAAARTNITQLRPRRNVHFIDLYSINEAAEVAEKAGLNAYRFYLLTKAGEIPGTARRGVKTVGFEKTQFKKWIASNQFKTEIKKLRRAA